MKIVIYDEDGFDGKGQEWAKFYIPDDASKEWIEKNVPPLIRAAQLFMGKIESTGY